MQRASTLLLARLGVVGRQALPPVSVAAASPVAAPPKGFRALHRSIPALSSGGSPWYQTTYQESIAEPDAFWGKQARDLLHWRRDFEVVRRHDVDSGAISWFDGGELNASGASPSLPQLDRSTPPCTFLSIRRCSPSLEISSPFPQVCYHCRFRATPPLFVSFPPARCAGQNMLITYTGDFDL